MVAHPRRDTWIRAASRSSSADRENTPETRAIALREDPPNQAQVSPISRVRRHNPADRAVGAAPTVTARLRHLFNIHNWRTIVKNCVKCGSDELRIRRENSGSYGMNALPLGKGKPASVAMDNLICTSCGYVEFFVSDATALAKIAKTWERPQP